LEAINKQLRLNLFIEIQPGFISSTNFSKVLNFGKADNFKKLFLLQLCEIHGKRAIQKVTPFSKRNNNQRPLHQYVKVENIHPVELNMSIIKLAKGVVRLVGFVF
jgi:hypothetical protein